MSRAKFRQRSYLLRCRTCGQGFLEMLELLKHRDRCRDDAQNQVRNHAGDGTVDADRLSSTKEVREL
jgi:hypothetical protein